MSRSQPRTILFFVAAILGAIFFSSAGTEAATFNVPARYPTIQAAIDAASDGDSVLVAPGAYTETITVFNKGITIESSAGPGSTVIEAAKSGSNVVTFMNLNGKSCGIEGFTFRNSGSFRALPISVSSSSPTINGNVFDGTNSAWNYGAIEVDEISPVIANNIFLNVGDDNSPGGVVTVICGSSPKIFNNLFVNNRCTAIMMNLWEGSTPSDYQQYTCREYGWHFIIPYRFSHSFG